MTTKKSKTMAFLDALVGEPMTLGGLLVSIRKCDEIPQAALAKRLGISKSHLGDIEKGRKVVSLERAARFAQELGYSEEQFVRLALQQMVEVAGSIFTPGIPANRASASASSVHSTPCWQTGAVRGR